VFDLGTSSLTPISLPLKKAIRANVGVEVEPLPGLARFLSGP